MAGEVDQLLVRIDASTEALRRQLKRAERDISGFERSADRNVAAVETRFQRMGATVSRSIGGLGAILGGAALGREILGTITQFEQLDQRLRTLTGTTEKYEEAQGYLRSTSDRLATDIAATTDQYARLLTLQNSGLVTSEQARSLLEGFANAAAATGASTQSLNQVMYGLSQALSSGTVRAEEFNQVTEPMPGLLQSMERAAGLSAGGLRKLVNEGRVTSEMFGQIMVAALQEFSGEAEKRADTIGGKWQILNNTWINLQRSLSEPLADVLAPILATANDLLGTLGPIVGMIGQIEGAAAKARWNAGRSVGQALGLVGENRDELIQRRDILRSQLDEAVGMSPDAMEGLGGVQNYIEQISTELERVEQQIDALNPKVEITRGNETNPAITFGPGKGDKKGDAARKKAEREAEIARKRAEREAEQDTGAIAKLTDELALLEAVNEEERIRLERAQAVAAAGKDINNPELKPIAENLAGQIFDAQRNMDAAQKIADEGKAIFEGTRTATEEYAAKIQRLNELLMQGAINQETFGRATLQAKEELAKATAGTNELEMAMLGGLQHALVSVGGNFKNLEQVAVAAISHIITELIRMQQTAEAAGKSGPLSNLFGGGGGSGGNFLGTIVSGISGFFGGGGATLGPTVAGASAAGIPGGGFASGGRPHVGIASLVGEQGPEVFVPDVAGTVVPNFAIKPQGSGGGMQQIALSVALSQDLDARITSQAENVSMRVVRQQSPKIVSESVAATRASASEYPIR